MISRLERMSINLSELMAEPEHNEDPIEGAEGIPRELRTYALHTARYFLQRSHLSPDLAEDMVQTAFLKYHQLGREKLAKIDNHKAYLARIVRNEIKDHRRESRDNVTTVFEDTGTLESRSGERDLENRILVREIWSKLEGPDRRLFELMTLNYTGRELGWRLGISTDAARQRAHRLLAKLKDMLTENHKKAP